MLRNSVNADAVYPAAAASLSAVYIRSRLQGDITPSLEVINPVVWRCFETYIAYHNFETIVDFEFDNAGYCFTLVI